MAKTQIRYRKKQTEKGLFATGDRKKAEADGATYVDPQRFKKITAKRKKKTESEEESS